MCFFSDRLKLTLASWSVGGGRSGEELFETGDGRLQKHNSAFINVLYRVYRVLMLYEWCDHNGGDGIGKPDTRTEAMLRSSVVSAETRSLSCVLSEGSSL